MTSASTEQLFDLERQVRAVAEELHAARTIIPIMRKALDDIASWGEGPEVCGAFDKPGSAQIARNALVAAGFGWQKDMAITWGAFFSALAVGAIREEERAEFMKFVAIVSNPVVYIRGDKA